MRTRCRYGSFPFPLCIAIRPNPPSAALPCPACRGRRRVCALEQPECRSHRQTHTHRHTLLPTWPDESRAVKTRLPRRRRRPALFAAWRTHVFRVASAVYDTPSLRREANNRPWHDGETKRTGQTRQRDRADQTGGPGRPDRGNRANQTEGPGRPDRRTGQTRQTDRTDQTGGPGRPDRGTGQTRQRDRADQTDGPGRPDRRKHRGHTHIMSESGVVVTKR